MPRYVQANIIKTHPKPLTLVFLKNLQQELSQLCIPHLHTMQGYPQIQIEHSNVTEDSVHAQVSVTVKSDLHLPLQRASPGLSHLCIWLFCLFSLFNHICLSASACVCVSLSISVLRIFQVGFKPDA